MNLGMPTEDWEVRKLDKCTCRYCDLSGLGNFDVWMNLGIDHIVPRSSRLDETGGNKAVACAECNILKGDYVPAGGTREERIADARRYVQQKREHWRSLFEKMMAELGALV
jgi:5-methylcytosine-specific restriction endonuclease McrA